MIITFGTFVIYSEVWPFPASRLIIGILGYICVTWIKCAVWHISSAKPETICTAQYYLVREPFIVVAAQ